MNRKGKTFFKNQYAGLIEEIDEGYKFTYHPDYLALPDAWPVSVTMPLREEPYLSRTLFPFFDGLIPEGWMLDIAVHNWKIDSRDRMGLLLSVCRDCIGAVSVEALHE